MVFATPIAILFQHRLHDNWSSHPKQSSWFVGELSHVHVHKCQQQINKQIKFV